MAISEERMLASGEAEICTQAFGDPGDPPMLLIMGQMASMLWWPEALCERLAALGRFVIRYDHRDTGRSTHYQPGAPAYSGTHLTADAIAVLDGYGAESAHLVGFSAGGGIAQEIALTHPDRVASVTAISTTSIDPADTDLPGPRAEYLEHSRSAEGLDWSDREAVASFLVADSRALASSKHPFDAEAARSLVERDLVRNPNPASLVNHAIMEDEGGQDPTIAQIGIPFLVIHGSADPLFPLEHGLALAERVPGAAMVTIEGGGHELHQLDWDRYVEAIARVTQAPIG